MLFISLWSKIILLLFVTIAYGNEEADLTATYCDGSGWVPYLDEKCFKLIKRWATRDDAKNLCAEELLPTDPSIPQLVSIKSPEEQEYLTKYVFDDSAVKISVWLGAKRLLLNSNTFVWDDESEIDYSNWAQGSPTDKAEIDCVEMQSEFVRQFANSSNTNLRNRVKGKWRDVTCELPNYVICEKLQRWSFGKMQQSFITTRKEMKDSFDLVTKEMKDSFVSLTKELNSTKIKLSNTQSQLSNTQSQLSNTQSQLSNTQSQLSNTQSQLSNTQSQLSNTQSQLSTAQNQITTNRGQLTVVQNNPVPIGFIYVQLPKQPEPKSIWPMIEWTQITAEYAGLFFRAEGSGSAGFGTVQGDNSPRLTQVQFKVAGIRGTNGTTIQVAANNQWSAYVQTGGTSAEDGLRFIVTSGEVRPRNQAIRIWKRTK